MSTQDYLRRVTDRLLEDHGVVLSDGARGALYLMLAGGQKRATQERREEVLDQAVETLAKRLGSVLAESGLERTMPTGTATVSTESFASAWQQICPLWPFC